jgi:hypothetical protein
MTASSTLDPAELTRYVREIPSPPLPDWLVREAWLQDDEEVAYVSGLAEGLTCDCHDHPVVIVRTTEDRLKCACVFQLRAKEAS